MGVAFYDSCDASYGAGLRSPHAGRLIQVAYAIPPTPEGVKACDDRGSNLVAFRLTRHRIWAVGQGPLGCI